MHGREVFIVDAVRTPVGRFGGAFAGVRPDDLAAVVIRSLLDRTTSLDPARIGEVCFGAALLLEFGPGAQLVLESVFAVVRVLLHQDELAVVDVAQVFKVLDRPVVPVGRRVSGAVYSFLIDKPTISSRTRASSAHE